MIQVEADISSLRSLRPRGRAADVLLALFLAGFEVFATFQAQQHAGPHDVRQLDLTGCALLAAGPLGLALRRRLPSFTLLWVWAFAVAYVGIGYFPGPVFAGLIVAFYTALTIGNRLVAYGALAAGYVVFGFFLPTFSRPGLAASLGLAAWLLVLAGIAEGVRVRRRLRRTEQQRATEAEQVRQEQARRRAGEERLLIAQDLHDVLAHQLALITVQANVGLEVMRVRPDGAEAPLRAIKDAGNRALAELRSVLDVLRADAPRRPAPLLSRHPDVAALIDGATSAGLTVHLDSADEGRPLPAAVDQAGYRIVQEALTNAVRHAGPGTTVRISLARSEDTLTLHVTDDGRAAAPDQEGNGIPGMRERATALGGELRAGPRPDGGFEVAAKLPVRT